VSSPRIAAPSKATRSATWRCERPAGDEAELSYGGTSAQTERSKRSEATSRGGCYGNS
jgi:hypothetical protein